MLYMYRLLTVRGLHVLHQIKFTFYESDFSDVYQPARTKTIVHESKT